MNKSFKFYVLRLSILILLGTTINPSLQAQNVGIGTTSPEGELHVTRPYIWQGINFIGSGVDDIEVDHSSYTDEAERTYIIKVTNAGPDPNIFKWSDDEGSTWTTNVAMSVSYISLSHGIQVRWASTKLHIYDDEWEFEIGPDYNNGLVVNNGQVAIGGTTPDPSALLDMTSTDKGLLIPRMTSAQRTAISSPATGLQVYDTDNDNLWFYNGTSWFMMLNGSGSPFDGTTLLTDNEQLEVAAWTGYNNLEWELCYRKSTDIQTATEFHSKCNARGPSLVLIKLSNGRIFGGFTEVSWRSASGYTQQDKSFIFSIDNMIKYPLVDNSKSIYDHPSYGPVFGGGHDIFINAFMNLEYANFPYSYARDGTYLSTNDVATQELCGLNTNTSASIVELEVWVH